MSISRSIKTGESEIHMGDDGIIRIVASGEKHTLDDAKEVTAAIGRIAGDKKYPVLIDSTHVKEMTPESRAYYASEEGIVSISAIAIMIRSGIPRLTANFLLDLSRTPGPPRRLFDDESKALQWLGNFVGMNKDPAAIKQEADAPNILIYEPISQMQKPIIYTLIKQGIRCLCIKEKKQIITRLKSKKFNWYICSITPETRDILENIKEIRNYQDLADINIILWTPPSSKEFFEEMLKLGIKGFIIKPFVQETFEKSLFRLLLQGNANPADRRKSIRVEPGDDDRIIVAIRTAVTHKTIVGKLKSISMDGMVIELTENFNEDDLNISDEILNNNIKITVNDNDISTNGVVYARKNGLVVIKFSEMQEYYKTMLSSYIYKRINQ